ncbi:MAG TPA: SDR family NAD(P)-dependent oxidoreductase [Vineibacter sp.]|nr:SDR family NAD(P)-dependent oxidoreductase [Vineibacter sp.]
MAGRLKGKVAVVTGAAPRGEGVGNGMATAILFAREGAQVVLVNRSAERAEKLARQIREEGGEAAVFAGDVARPEVAEAMAAFAVDTYGRLDVLHNNVGIGGGVGTPEGVSLETWNKVLEVNLTTTMLCTKYCLPRMKAGGGGSVIMVSSIAGALGLMGSAGAVAYATAKAGLHGFTLSVAADYATQNIRANCIIVGSVHTPMVAGMGEEARERRKNMVPMKTEGTAWDVAHGAVYLASDESRWVTGILLPIDGGLVALRQWPR